ncbi:hypothetical protein AVEN_179147-1, partial [Araneus ventricosus]
PYTTALLPLVASFDQPPTAFSLLCYYDLPSKLTDFHADTSKSTFSNASSSISHVPDILNLVFSAVFLPVHPYLHLLPIPQIHLRLFLPLYDLPLYLLNSMESDPPPKRNVPPVTAKIVKLIQKSARCNLLLT